ncbi:PAS domain-containing sensor histidine kinase [Rufibacter roseus]|uniref:histidine kinase n=1 Tax=Rufibacter roseus TaxID=1567108 RepID=A0ABW2DKQ5_9BACT|nr:PAS domain-containing sensor histidine kinase [Rufibacter roseus]
MRKDINAAVWGKLAYHSCDLLCTFDKEGNFQHVNDASESVLGYSSGELIGHHYTKFLYTDDLSLTQKAISDMEAGKRLSNFENRFFRKDNQIVHVQWSASLSAEDSLIYAIGRDVTGLRLGWSKLEESEQKYKALFEHSKDVFFMESSEGLITDVNQSFCDAFLVTREEAVNSRASSFFPSYLAKTADITLRSVLEGSIMRGDVEIETETGKIKIYDTIKYPIHSNGKIIGVQTVARDITPMVCAYEAAQKQAEKLNNILNSITDGFVTVDRDWRITYLNKEAERLLPLDIKRHIGLNIWDIFPEEVGGEFYAYYHQAFETNSTVNFTAYLKKHSKWLKVKAYSSKEGLSIYFDDVTAQVEAQREIEKLSLVASKTAHGVVITDADGRTEWINESFTQLTGYTLADLKGRKPGSLLQGEETDSGTLEYIREMLNKRVPFSTEIINYRKSGEKLWFAMDITPVFDENGELNKFIAIQKDITESVRTQREIERLSLVAKNTTNGVIIAGQEGKIEYVNEGFTALTGYSFDEALGKTPYELLSSKHTDPEINRHIHEQLFLGKPSTFEILNTRKDGSDVWFSVQLNPIFGEGGKVERYIAIQSDITEMIRVRQELEKLSLVASKTNNGVIIADSNWKMEWVNEGFTRLFGYEMAEAVGKEPSELLHGPKTDKSKFLALEAKLLSGEPISFDIQNLKKNGEEIWLNVEISPAFDQEGTLVRYIEIQTEITSLKTSELELSRLADDLYRKNNDLQQFTYIVSHVLRQHGANIMGLVDMIIGADKNSDVYNRSLTYLKQSAYKLDEVLRDMNNILNIRENRGNVEVERVEVEQVLDQALSPFTEWLQNHDTIVSIDLPKGLAVKANRAYLYSIFHQLLSNSFKFRSSSRSLEINVAFTGNTEAESILTFSDNGIGFDSAKESNNLFKLYKRFHTQQEGRGIGLYLAKQQVEAMGGRLQITSEADKGTTVQIYLPQQ